MGAGSRGRNADGASASVGQEDRRDGGRLERAYSIAVRVVRDDGSSAEMPGSSFMRLTRDVSRRGLQFSSSDEIPAGTSVRVYIALDQPRRILALNGSIRWARPGQRGAPYVLGVEIHEDGTEDLAVFQDHVGEHLGSEN